MVNEPWWTVKGVESDQIVNVAVSPFYVQIEGAGLPTSIPFASSFGIVARIVLLASAFLLGLTGLRPRVWWRNLATWFASSSTALAFLSLALLLHGVRTVLLYAYGASPPFFGTANLPGSILGIDLAYHVSPLVSAAFSAYFFLALVSVAIVGVDQVPLMRSPAKLLMDTLTARRTAKIDLKPLPRLRTFSSSQEVVDFLRSGLERMTEDELLVSFRSLNTTLEPGVRVSLRVPAGATSLTERLLRLIPHAGFHLERLQVVCPTPGTLENELVFRRLEPETGPASQPRPASTPEPESIPEAIPEPQTSSVDETVAQSVEQDSSANSIDEAVPEVVQQDLPPPVEEPSPLERAIVESAIVTITKMGVPVPYNALINEVYVDLLNRNLEFTSLKQIETILTKHVGHELAIQEDAQHALYSDTRKWRLAELQGPAEHHHLWNRTSTKAKTRVYGD